MMNQWGKASVVGNVHALECHEFKTIHVKLIIRLCNMSGYAEIEYNKRIPSTFRF